MDALEPDSNVGNKSNLSSKLRADFPLVDVIRKAVRDEVIGEERNVVLLAGLGSSTRITRHTKDRGLAAQERHQWRNTNLRSGGIAAWVRDTLRLGDRGAVHQLGKTIGPAVVETVVGAQIDNNRLLFVDFVDGINKRLADAVGKSHDPAVHIAVLSHTANIVRAQVLVDDIALGVALERLSIELSRGDVAQIHIGMGVHKADESLSSESTSSNQGHSGGTRVGSILLPKWGIGVRGGVRADGGSSKEASFSLTSSPKRVHAAHSRESALLLIDTGADAACVARSTGNLGWGVDIAQHTAAMLGKLGDEVLDFLAALDTTPEEDFTVVVKAPVCLVEEPGKVLVICSHGPHQFREVLLHACEDVVSDVGQPASLCDSEGCQMSGRRSVLWRKHHSKGLHGSVKVGLEFAVLERIHISINGGLGIQSFAVTDKGFLESVEVFKVGEGRIDVDLVSSTDESSSARFGEQLLLEISWVDNGDARRARKVHEQVLHLLDLQSSSVSHPPLSHQRLVLLVQIDGGDLLAGITIEQTTLLGEVDDLQRLQGSRKLAGSDIGVHVEDLTIGGLGHGGQDWEASGLDSSLDWLLVNPIDLANQVVLLLVQVVCGKDAGSDGSGPHAQALQFLHKLEVLLQEKRSGQRQSLPIGDANSILKLWLDTGVLEHLIQLRTSAMHNDGVEADMVEERERGGQGL